VKLRGVASLGVAQTLALAAALGGATVYAGWLDAPTLAAWMLALSAARAALLLVDAGIKTALVRRHAALRPGEASRLQRLVAAAALLLSAAGALALALLWGRGQLAAGPAVLTGVSVAAYLLSHALLLPALVRLERAGRFDVVGRAEGLGILLEFALPVLLAGLSAWQALAAGVMAGRLVRAGWIVWAVEGRPETVSATATAAAVAPDQALWRDALPVQGMAALSMVRDQVHLWLVGPWFGIAWAGAYAFALLACALASQVVVATVARVALPALRPLGPARRALRAARGLRRLLLLTLPLLAATVPLVVWANSGLWDERWSQALQVLPGLVLRMVLALPLAVMAPWLLVAAPTPVAFGVTLRWTGIELVLAVVALALLGPVGLAWSWALGGAIGTWLHARALRPHGLRYFMAALWRSRPPRRPLPGPMARSKWLPKSMSC
jgi:O-antigen/teichoic acid export membrane protein